MAFATEAEEVDAEFQDEDLPGESSESSGGKKSKRPWMKVAGGWWVWLSNFTDTEWDGMIGYLYRYGPKYDATLGGKRRKYVHKFVGRFDESTVMDTHGSGDYAIQLNEQMAMGKQRSIGYYQFELMDPNKPPKLPRGPWINDPANVKWRWGPFAKPWREGESDEPDKPPQQQQQQDFASLFRQVREIVHDMKPEAKQDETAAITKAIIQASQTAGEHTWQMFQAQASANDPVKMMALVKDLMAVVAPAKSGPDATTTILMEFLKTERENAAAARRETAEAQRANTELLMKMIEKSSPTKGLLEQVGEFAQITTAIKDAFGGEAVKTGWLDLVKDTVTPIVTNLAPVGAFFLQNKIREGMAKQAQPAPQQGVRPQVVHQMPPATTVNQVASNPAQDQPPPIEMTEDMNNNPQLVALMNIAKWTANSLEMGLDGSVFAEEIIVRRMGEGTYDQITSITPEQLLNTMKTFPPAWQLLAQYEEQLPKFMQEFYDWGKPEDEETPPEPAVADAVVPPKPPKRGKKTGVIQ